MCNVTDGAKTVKKKDINTYSDMIKKNISEELLKKSKKEYKRAKTKAELLKKRSLIKSIAYKNGKGSATWSTNPNTHMKELTVEMYNEKEKKMCKKTYGEEEILIINGYSSIRCIDLKKAFGYTTLGKVLHQEGDYFFEENEAGTAHQISVTYAIKGITGCVIYYNQMLNKYLFSVTDIEDEVLKYKTFYKQNYCIVKAYSFWNTKSPRADIDYSNGKPIYYSDGEYQVKYYDELHIKKTRGELKISLDGLKLLAEMEVNSNSKYIVKDQGKLIGIITHDVGDGGLTVGYGFFIKGGMNNVSELNRLKKEYDIIVKEGVVVDIDKVLNLYYESIVTYENRARLYINDNGVILNQHEFDALVIQSYNGAHYNVMDAFGDKSLSDAQALEKALQKYRTFKTWNIHGDGWTNRLKNIINLYRYGDYKKLY